MLSIENLDIAENSKFCDYSFRIKESRNNNLLTQGDLKVFQRNQAPPWSLKNVGNPGRNIILKDYDHSTRIMPLTIIHLTVLESKE